MSLWVAVRHLRSQPANQFAALVGLASVIGVALGVAALIVVLSVMNGFENELRGRLVAITGHATVMTGAGVPDWEAVASDASRYPGVTSATPYVELEAMLAHGSDLAGGVIEGIDPVRESGPTSQQYPVGGAAQLEAGAWRAVLGRALALRLGVGEGDTIRLLVPVRGPDGAVTSRLRDIQVAGTFEVGVKDHDSVRVLMHIADAAVLADLGTGVTGIRLQTKDIFAAPAITQAWLEQWLARGGRPLRTSDWTRENATYFRAVRLEKMMMTLLLSLIVSVAAFNIVATLVMIVTDKRPGVAILRTLGFSRPAVVAIFTIQGLILGWIGVLVGVSAGCILAWNIGSVAPALERLFGFEFMPADVYYLTALPADLRAVDVFWVGGLALLMTALATIYPAMRAAAVDPAEVLRYE